MRRRRKSWGESVQHRKAKVQLARWLRAGIRRELWGLSKTAKVYLEWPLLDEHKDGSALWKGRPPTFNALKEIDFIPKAILDVCVVDGDRIIAGFEVWNWHECTPQKVEFLNKLPFTTVEIDSGWIVSQRTCPDTWPVYRSFGMAA